MTADPKRLLDDPSVQAEVRDDLARAMQAPLPAYDVEKGLERLLSATAVAGGAAAGTTLAKWTFLRLLKWGLLGSGGVATVALVAQTVVNRHEPESTVSTFAHAPSAIEIPIAPPVAPTVETPNEVTVTPPAGPAAHTATPLKHDRATEADDRVAREVALLGKARAALSSNPSQALKLTEEGKREFPQGVLREEREAIAVLALTQLGQRKAAQLRGRAFLARYPSGPFSERVRVALDGTTKDAGAL